MNENRISAAPCLLIKQTQNISGSPKESSASLRHAQQKIAAAKILVFLRKQLQVKLMLAQKLSVLMISAQKTIARTVRSHLLRLNLAKGHLQVRLYWSESLSTGTRGQKLTQSSSSAVFVVGNFTNPPWMVRLPMHFERADKLFSADVILPFGSQFKFIVDGLYQTSLYYPTVKDGQFENNVYFIRKSVYRQMNNTQLLTGLRPNKSSQRNETVKTTADEFRLKSVIPQPIKQELHSASKCGIKINNQDIRSSQQSQILKQNSSPPQKQKELLKLTQQASNFTKASSNNQTISHQKQSQQAQLYIPQQRRVLKAKAQKHKYSVYDCGSSAQSDNSAQDISNIDISSVASQEDPINNTQRITLKRHESDSQIIECEQYIFVGDSYQIAKNIGGSSEDACFITDIGLGVSDGVGSWGSYGIDCSLFSNTLMKECSKFIQRVVFRQQQSLIDHRITPEELECHRQALETSMESLNSHPSSDSDSSYVGYNTGHRQSGSTSSLLNFQAKNLCPTNILKFSLRRTHYPGSATATLCVLNNRDLSALNLGDSGFILIRFDNVTDEPYVLIRSKEQTHGFNTPFQLTKLPSQKEVQELKALNKQKELQNLKKALRDKKFCDDAPEDSDIYQLRVRDGDLIILATDGVFDNLFQEEILSIVRKTLQTGYHKTKATALTLSRLIAEAAHAKAKRNNIKTPFNIKKAKAIFEFKQKVKNKAAFNSSIPPTAIMCESSAESPISKETIKQVVNGNEQELEEVIKMVQKADEDFEKLCHGRGKQDDITVVSAWIQNRMLPSSAHDVSLLHQAHSSPL